MAKSDENEDWPRTNQTEPDEALQTYVRRWKVYANVPLPYAGTLVKLVTGVRNWLQRSKRSTSLLRLYICRARRKVVSHVCVISLWAEVRLTLSIRPPPSFGAPAAALESNGV